MFDSWLSSTPISLSGYNLATRAEACPTNQQQILGQRKGLYLTQTVKQCWVLLRERNWAISGPTGQESPGRALVQTP